MRQLSVANFECCTDSSRKGFSVVSDGLLCINLWFGRQAYRWNDCVDHVAESLNSHQEGRGNAEAVVTCNGGQRANGW